MWLVDWFGKACLTHRLTDGWIHAVARRAGWRVLDENKGELEPVPPKGVEGAGHGQAAVGACVCVGVVGVVDVSWWIACVCLAPSCRIVF